MLRLSTVEAGERVLSTPPVALLSLQEGIAIGPAGRLGSWSRYVLEMRSRKKPITQDNASETEEYKQDEDTSSNSTVTGSQHSGLGPFDPDAMTDQSVNSGVATMPVTPCRLNNESAT